MLCCVSLPLRVRNLVPRRIVAFRQLSRSLKTGLQYFQVNAWKNQCHAVQRRADTVHTEYLHKLHDVDRAAGTPCPHTLTQRGSCARSDNDLDHGVGGGERHLRDKYGQVKALVFAFRQLSRSLKRRVQ
jgi:hypothetical protein